MQIDGRHIETSNRDKPFFPEAGLTKGDLVDYYADLGDTMLVHLDGHPVSLQRFPDGLDGEGFYQKDASAHFPDWLTRVRFPKREGGHFMAPVIDSRAALVYLADQAMITPHPYLARADDLERPDRLIFDLDPPEGGRDVASVRRAALDLRGLLDELSLSAWVQTTGSRGFHVVVPLDAGADFDASRAFARDTARVLVRRHPDRYTLAQRKRQRRGRIFLDVMRNAYGATAVAPYAVRALAGAPVATQLSWPELERGATPRGWTLGNLRRRLAQKADPWAEMARHAVALSAHREALDRLLAREPPAEEEA
ncbi:non-homologous end-joining DNA ligase [Halomonas beimenensis]|uniref:ATP-dependent DNA ligase clustered with Ku protein, LigD n=1 Tax=Halomonas beimenensis TaxID=475662 RepID=A0A291P371_9GAMM|nr:non-homologous end-joining DNA ligase [Halomonas beimenensis]ATJ81333.1 ATP-dependent DNA ligase clustered with Ku protein, LigD [Halomonas beimenensis]